MWILGCVGLFVFLRMEECKSCTAWGSACLMPGLEMSRYEQPPPFTKSRLSGGIVAGVIGIAVLCAAIAVWVAHRDRVAANAARICRSRAEQGDARSQFELGVDYAHGRGVPLDYAEAVRWLRKAADQGYAKAQFNLAYMYAHSQGVQQDYTEAFRWLGKAAKQGDVKAEVQLATNYVRGRGAQPDYAEALHWYRKAADQGDTKGEYGVGLCYYNGRGVPQDDAQAVSWYRRAAARGDAAAEYALGYMYYLGRGVPQDSIKAVRWYAEAARQDEPNARDALHRLRCSDGATQIRRWTSIVAILLLIPALLVPQRQCGRATWMSWALTSALCAVGAIHELRLSPLSVALLGTLEPIGVVWQGIGPRVLVGLLAAASATYAALAFREAARFSSIERYPFAPPGS
jgi:TPR repeat protein